MTSENTESTENKPCCPLCRTSETHLYWKSRLPWSARSDWQPMQVSAEVWHCGNCDHIFKDPVFVARWADYQNYDTHAGSQAQDKINYDTGYPRHRSAALLAFLEKNQVIRPESKVLDFGCNRGSFMKFLSGGNHAGFDVSPQYRSAIEALGFNYYQAVEELPKAAFDVLTLVHVFEHLSSPKMIQPGLDALAEKGSILIQVPHSMEQVTDWYITDHCAHYRAETVEKALHPFGLKTVLATDSFLTGELSVISRKGIEADIPNRNFQGWEPVRKSLCQAEDLLLDLIARDQPVRVFGAGFTGLMVTELFRSRVQCIIDENTALQGQNLAGVPVVGLTDAWRFDGDVVLAVPPPATARVLGLCREAGLNVHAPYWPGTQI